MKVKRKLLVASGNQGKVREIKNYLKDLSADLKFEIIAMDSFPELADVIEDGSTFEENALKKARIRAKQTGIASLADDSGLVVDCLDGAPGVYSARYAGEEASDDDNNQKLLREVKNYSFQERKACFKCVMALVDPEQDIEIIVKGECHGIIQLKATGEQGFAYDPLFFLPEKSKTMAELTIEEKNRISHRANALKAMKKEVKKRYR